MVRDPNGCPACGQIHPESTLLCPVTGVSLRFSDPKRAVGEVIGGKYRIDRVLGRGGMGAVYEAEHIELQKKVAIKILLPESSVKPQQVERFKREARSAASIGHDNIVQIFDLDTTKDGTIYIVMELLPGSDLGGILSRNSSGLPVDRVIRIGTQASMGLGAAHEHGIIHRDLKPENIFIASKPQGEQVKIVDFGIAMMRHGEAGRLTAEGVLIGTPFYMSPEQARGERNLTPQTDIYALGTVLYEMLTGAVLFDGDTYLEILAKHQVDPPPLLAERRPGLDVPARMEDLIQKMLAKDARNRPSSMAEVARILSACSGEAPARPVSPAAPPRPEPQKQGYAETIIAYQQPPREAPSARAAPPGDASTRATLESGESLEWSSDGGPSPTTVIRASNRRRKLAVVGGLVAVLAVAGIATAIFMGMGAAQGKGGRPGDPVTGGQQTTGKAVEDPGEQPGSVTLEVEVRPANAVILIDGRKADGNPARVEVEQGASVTLRAEAQGHTSVEKEIIADSNRSFSWQLEPLDVRKIKVKPGKAPPPSTQPIVDDGPKGKKKKIKVDKDNPYLSGS